MGKVIDLTGQRFGRWTVLEYRGTAWKSRTSQWLCKCECGNTSVVSKCNLVSGISRSCGCLGKEHRLAAVTKHKMAKNPHYFAWFTMRARCNNCKHKNYDMYGGRGIRVCEEWEKDFMTFYNYVSKLPHFGEEGRTLDRINDNGDYEPGNVRWATPREQANNTRRNVFFEVNGIKYTAREYAEKYGEPYDKVYYKYIKKPRIEAKRKEKEHGYYKHIAEESSNRPHGI